MEIQSRHLADVAASNCTRRWTASISVYVVTGVTDLNAIAEIVPARKSRSERTYTQPMSTILIMRKTRSTRSWKI